MKNNYNKTEDFLQGPDVLIIGNGFDLDLGLKTGYHHFYQSDYWPFNNPSTKMGEYLQKERLNAKNWMDLEAKLGDFAFAGRLGMGKNGVRLPYRMDTFKEDNINDYNELVSHLCDYLLVAENGKIDINSTAASVLNGYLNSMIVPHIFSFNYTNLRNIAKKLGIQKQFNYEHVHGNLANKNIIIGVGEKYTFNNYKHLPKGLDFLYKTSSTNYNPPLIADALRKANRITFFGLTIGGMDTPYFSGLFQDLSSQYGKIITFFTYDEQSRMQILRHLRNIETINLHNIWTRHSFEFIRTGCLEDKTKVEKYLHRLKTII